MTQNSAIEDENVQKRLLLTSRVCPRFLDQVEHQTINASIENKYFFAKQCHCQTYQNYE